MGGIGTSVQLAEHIAKQEGVASQAELGFLKRRAAAILRDNIGLVTVTNRTARKNGTYTITYKLNVKMPVDFRSAYMTDWTKT